jgi:hypothetical protein
MSDAHDQRTNTLEARERLICELLTGDRVTPLTLELIERIDDGDPEAVAEAERIAVRGEDEGGWRHGAA